MKQFAAVSLLWLAAVPLDAAFLGSETAVTVTPPPAEVTRHAPRALWVDSGPMLFWNEIRPDASSAARVEWPANGPAASAPVTDAQVSSFAGSPVAEYAAVGQGNEAFVAWTLTYGELYASRLSAEGHPVGQPTYLGQVWYHGGVRVAASRERYLVAWVDGSARPTVALLDRSGSVVVSPRAVSERQVASTYNSSSPAISVGSDGQSFLLAWSTFACIEGAPCRGPAQVLVTAIDQDGAAGAPVKVGTGYERPNLLWNGGSYGVLWQGDDDVLYARRVTAGGAAIDAAPVRVCGNWFHFPRAAWDGKDYLMAYAGYEANGSPNLTLARLSADLSTFSPLQIIPLPDPGTTLVDYETTDGEYDLAASRGRVILTYTVRNQIVFRLGQGPAPARPRVARP